LLHEWRYFAEILYKIARMNDNDMQLASGIAAFEAKEFRRAWQLLDEGNADAQYRCAIMLQNGLGVIAQPKKAAGLLQLAVDQGFGLAQHSLGICYLYGEGVTQNTPQAVALLEQAGESGLAGAWTTLGMIYMEGQGIEKDEARAREYYTKAGFDPDEFT
jgi:TPR repeat protein